VAQILEDFGAQLINADELGYEFLRPHTPEYRAIVKRFGKEILTQNGEIDRRSLGQLIFSNPERRKLLNRIVHPKLLSKLRRAIALAQNELVLVDAALIFDWGLESELDGVILVRARDEVKIERLVSQGLSELEARDRLKSQLSEAEMIKKADYVIENNGSLEELKMHCQELFKQLIPI
jgi:dephospho-CoA kinase